jgi:F-type H+-transporting ATPase subunit epsilon
MSQEFNIEIISPDGKIFNGKCIEAILPCFEGQVTILKDHISLITFLRPGLITIDSEKNFYIEEGTVEFFDNKLLILTSLTLDAKELRDEKIANMIKDAEEKLTNNKVSDKQKYILNYKIETLKQIN